MAKDTQTKQPDPDIEYRGSKITLPEDPSRMDLETAVDVLKRKAEDAKVKMDVFEIIEHHPYDALVAFNWAMRETYGWASPTPKMSFFGPIAPDLITIKTGPKPDDHIQVPHGSFTLPNVTEPVETVLDFGDNRLIIAGSVRKADHHVVVNLAKLARERLKTHSIFKGHAIHVPCVDGSANFQSMEYIDTDYIRESDLVLNDDELEQVRASLWTPIQHTEACLAHNIPLNRGVLLEGTYGTGKTMTANVTSRICRENGWTYILLDDVRGLKEALLMAQRYQPCVVFAEDIDRVVSERDQRGNDILNTIDGVLTKNAQVITVLTTNHVERLERAMLRPGRLDAVISVKPPEEGAVKRLIRTYGGSLIDKDDPLDNAAKELAGNIPATIREVTERAKLSMIADGRERIMDEDLVVAAKGMSAHLELLVERKPTPSAEQRLGDAMREITSGVDFDALAQRLGVTEKVMKSAVSAVRSNTASVTRRLDAIRDDTTYIREEVSA